MQSSTGSGMRVANGRRSTRARREAALPEGEATPERPGRLLAADDAARWEAVRTRDARADVAFVYGVRTTGIYCRATCRSRLPLRKNVVFFADAAAAERDGFRPCKRCRPQAAGAGAGGGSARHAAAVARAVVLIESATEPLALGALAAAVHMSPHHFHRVFKAAVGMTPKAFADARRAAALQRSLGAAGSVTEAIVAAGFGSESRVYERATALLGMRPGDYRRGAAGRQIRFAVAPSALGWIGVAASDRGVCMVAFGDDRDGLHRAVADRFPRAVLHEGDAQFAAWVRRVVALVDRPSAALDLPLDMRGTLFQRRVWHALRQVSPGTTVTYSELARRVGKPRAVRAVAAACAANDLAVVVPCHRAIRRDGGLAGYRWGIERKRALLAREGEAGSGGDGGAASGEVG